MYNLGISCYYHDSAAALLRDGHVVAAVEEERFSRKKFDDDFLKISLTGTQNIRDTTFYPRDVDRLTP